MTRQVCAARPLFPDATPGSLGEALAAGWADLDRHAELVARLHGTDGAMLRALIDWGVAVHATDREVLWATARRSPARIALHLAARARIDLEIPAGLLSRPAVRRALAHDAAMSPRVLEAVALAEPPRPLGWSATTLDILGQNPSLDERGVVALIARGANVAAATSLHATPAQLRELARDPTTHRALAENPNTPADLLVTLVNVDEQLAKHPATPWTQVERLLDAPHDAVAEAAASHPNIPAARLGALAEATRKAHRRGVATHPALPAALRARLLADANPVVRAAAIGGPLSGTELAKLLATAGVHRDWLSPKIAAHANTSSATLDELARDPRNTAAVAARPEISDAMLVAFSTHDEPLVRRSVACNPRTPLEVIARLARDNEEVVYRDAFARLPWREADRIVRELEPELAKKRKLENIGLDPRLSPRWLGAAARKYPLEVAQHPRALLEDLP